MNPILLRWGHRTTSVNISIQRNCSQKRSELTLLVRHHETQRVLMRWIGKREMF